MATGFGCNLLKKMGWKEGTGIGKSENGIVEPIKLKLKLGTEGIGFKESERLCSGWWMDAFNKAAAAGADASTSHVASKTTTAAPVLGRPYSVAFASAASVLRNGCEESSKAATSESCLAAETPSLPALPKVPSDADLLAACAGRTAHCAARFGLSLGGKLARVRAQDVLSNSGATVSSAEEESEKIKRKKKKRKQKDSELMVEDESDVAVVLSVKKRKRTKKRDAELVAE